GRWRDHHGQIRCKFAPPTSRGNQRKTPWKVVPQSAAAAARQPSSSQGKGGARCHSAVWFGQIDHPPDSPDLAPSDYFLFGNL
ncbi:hypothetical protein M514_07214, partial [Trichuris suis]